MTLTQHLESNFDPVQFGRLEEFSCFETAEQMLPVQRLRPLLVQFVEDPAFQQLLVGHADLDGMIRGAPARRGHRRRVGVTSRRRRLPKVEVRKRSEKNAESRTFP